MQQHTQVYVHLRVCACVCCVCAFADIPSPRGCLDCRWMMMLRAKRLSRPTGELCVTANSFVSFLPCAAGRDPALQQAFACSFALPVVMLNGERCRTEGVVLRTLASCLASCPQRANPPGVPALRNNNTGQLPKCATQISWGMRATTSVCC